MIVRLLCYTALLLSGVTAFAPSSRTNGYVVMPQQLSKARTTTTLVPNNNNNNNNNPFKKTTTTTTSTQLYTAADPRFAIAAITGAITGGLFAGGLHAIAGPDHLAALLPRCCGQRWYKAGRVGALWGMGHGVSATILGVSAFALKNSLGKGTKAFLARASHLTEIAVGFSLVLIGVMGIKEAREWGENHIESKTLSAAANNDDALKTAQKRAVIFNGLLHGFSWDGAPSLAPAIAVATWSGNLAFLSAYAIGTMSTMAIVTTFIGEGTRRAGEIFQRPDLPQKLSFASSILAIIIGVIWCGLGFL